ncbi:hypothetical protein IPP75_04800 [Candidatus Saccharibacteria bacterium]|nr:MAG: hypothetical protein IPP75_04800 [Candidatus Saccharibacteria bacterium]
MSKSKNGELAPIRYSFHPTSGPDSEQVAVGGAVWGKLVPNTRKDRRWWPFSGNASLAQYASLTVDLDSSPRDGTLRTDYTPPTLTMNSMLGVLVFGTLSEDGTFIPDETQPEATVAVRGEYPGATLELAVVEAIVRAQTS